MTWIAPVVNWNRDMGVDYNAFNRIESNLQYLYDERKLKVATGTANAIILDIPALVNGCSTAFIASANNNGQATTINGIPVYLGGSTISPTFKVNYGYTIWYKETNNCFYVQH